MGGPARLWVLLAVAAATPVAAAADRFVPADPGFVVANVRQTQPDVDLRDLLVAWRTHPGATEAVALATAYLARARSLREPVFFGRAEAVLEPLASRPGANASLRRLYAEVLQHRHAFADAETLLDSILREVPHDPDARLLRASVRLVRGEFTGARVDCAQLLGASGSGAMLGFACLAEALAGAGDVDRGLALLESTPVEHAGTDPFARAYLLATRAELRERGHDLDGAILDYADALKLAPRDDSLRAALADALAARGDVAEARALLAIDKPGLALLVRSAMLSDEKHRAELGRRANAWLELERARGDAVHYREAAMLALAEKDPARALAAATRNFESQRELPDVRVLARAALAAGDASAQQALRLWLRQTGYRDAVTESILGGSAGS